MGEGVWKKVENAESLQPGQMLGADVEGLQIALFNIDGVIYATSNICTHAFTYLSEGWFEDCVIECPLHAGRFDVRDGKGQGAPITQDLRTYKVRQTADGGVEVELAGE
jgi:nitrite reductase/ring-hydroxylating ferredoxin subunit